MITLAVNLYFFLKVLLLFEYLCACVWKCMSMYVDTCFCIPKKTEDGYQEAILLFKFYVDSRVWTQALRLAQQSLLPTKLSLWPEKCILKNWSCTVKCVNVYVCVCTRACTCIHAYTCVFNVHSVRFQQFIFYTLYKVKIFLKWKVMYHKLCGNMLRVRHLTRSRRF